MTVDVSVILVNYNTAALLEPCLRRLAQATSSLKSQTLIVDNASRDDSVELLRADYGHHEIVENTVNVGFGRANNQVLGRAVGRYVLLLNTDAFVDADAVRSTVAYMDAHPRCGVLGVRLVGRDGALQPSCRYFPTPWNVFLNRTGLNAWFTGTRMVDEWNWDHATVRQCDWVPGCFYLVRREVIDTVGLFDPRYFLYYEEVDHCRRVKAAGWDVTYFPGTQVVHIGGESARSEHLLGAGSQISALQIESELLYFRKHHGLGGAALAMVLTLVGDAIIAAKALLRRSGVGTLAAIVDHSVATLKSFWDTRAGAHATR